MNIRKIDFPANAYVQEEHPKTQVYLHHTAGNADGEGVFKWWASNPEDIGTCVAISGPSRSTVDGEIVQGFSSRFWAYHLGLRESTFHKLGLRYRSLDKSSIGIEICNWGQIELRKDGKYYTYTGREIDATRVIKLDKPHRGHLYFHNYSDAQIESVRQLLLHWNLRYGIPLRYNEDIWDVSRRALRGEPGVYTHNSVRFDKLDVYPHPKLIEMLKSLTTINK